MPNNTAAPKTTEQFWELQFVLYCKGHFEKFQGETLHDLRHMYCRRIKWDGPTNKDVTNYLLTNIIQPYVLPNLTSHSFVELMEDISPEFVYRTGYPNELPYDYYAAITYKLVSLIRNAPANWFPKELLEASPDQEIFMGSTRATAA